MQHPYRNPTEQGFTAQRERVQRRFRRGLIALKALNYEARLKELGIMFLAARRDYLDLTMAYKLLHGLVDTDYYMAKWTCTS